MQGHPRCMVIVKSSDKTWSTGGGNSDPFQYSCLKNPTDSTWLFIGRTNTEHFDYLMQRKDPDAGEDWRQKEKDEQRMRWLGSITESMDMNVSNLREVVESRGTGHAAAHGISKSRTWLSDWKTTSTGGNAQSLFRGHQLLICLICCNKVVPQIEWFKQQKCVVS